MIPETPPNYGRPSFVSLSGFIMGIDFQRIQIHTYTHFAVFLLFSLATVLAAHLLSKKVTRAAHNKKKKHLIQHNNCI